MDDVRKKAKDLEASVLSLSSGSHNTEIQHLFSQFHEALQKASIIGINLLF